jgi:hypothetical protein
LIVVLADYGETHEIEGFFRNKADAEKFAEHESSSIKGFNVSNPSKETVFLGIYGAIESRLLFEAGSTKDELVSKVAKSYKVPVSALEWDSESIISDVFTPGEAGVFIEETQVQ